MIDEDFVRERVDRGEFALTRADRLFRDLTFEQFNWKPTASTWSVAECLQHLLIAHRCYLKDFSEIAGGSYEMTFWERHSPLTHRFGVILKTHMKEEAVTKSKTHRTLNPQASWYDTALLEQYVSNLSAFLKLVWDCRNVDLDATIINSPTIRWVTYSLRDAIEFLIEHEHRHINQAASVMNHEKFPGAMRSEQCR